ncbi:hypothetical protein [Paenarthrobacter sp. NPDC018779]|uniref:hypothetical protein n=1 Tax=Paenarthrobacter sp. NPDC018779 TaxID=3364375 RepID=UPI0037CA4124
MTVRLDAEGASFSDASCFRCAQAGPHWASRHAAPGQYACRRCFATFLDEDALPGDAGLSGMGVAVPHNMGLLENK